jgi:hypothetical protein
VEEKKERKKKKNNILVPILTQMFMQALKNSHARFKPLSWPSGFDLAVYSLIIGLFSYLAVRAATLSFTYDEVDSYRIVMGDQVRSNTANHHWLNTFLMRVSVYLFGISELSLRLFNLLSFIPAALAVLSIQKHVSSKFISLLLWLSFLNPYVLDFFSLARGYGLSISFMMCALAQALNLLSAKRPATLSRLLLLNLYICLALFANFTLLNFYVALVLAFGYLMLNTAVDQQVKSAKKSLYLFFLIALLPLIPSYLRLSFLKEKHELYYGYETLNETLQSLSTNSLYFESYSTLIQHLIFFGIPIILGFSLLVMVPKFKSFPKHSFVTLILALIVIALLVEHHFLGALNPRGRTGLYLIPLLNICLSFSLDKLIILLRHSIVSALTKFVTLCLLVIGTYHFTKTFNFKYTLDWRYDACSKAIINRTASVKNARLCTVWIFFPSMNFYNELHQHNIKVYGLDGAEQYEWLYTESKNIDTTIWKKDLPCDCNDFVLYSNKRFHP